MAHRANRAPPGGACERCMSTRSALSERQVRRAIRVARSPAILAVVVLSACLSASCGVVLDDGWDNGWDDDGWSVFHCTYEERMTSCNSTSFGPWESECRTVDFELRDGLTPEGFCQEAYSGSDTECAGGCCMDFEFRNTEAHSGACP